MKHLFTERGIFFKIKMAEDRNYQHGHCLEYDSCLVLVIKRDIKVVAGVNTTVVCPGGGGLLLPRPVQAGLVPGLSPNRARVSR